MISTKKIASFAAAATPFVVFPSRVLAQLQPIANPDVSTVSNVDARFQPLMTYTPSQMLATVLNVMLGVAGVASFVILLWGGLQWILAGGDKEGTEKARKKITAALIGLAIVFSAYALLYILRVLFGIDLIQVNLQRIGTA
jgi:hypothetical protein